MVLARPHSFYHSEKLQSTKTRHATGRECRMFYHSEKLQSTKTMWGASDLSAQFYHSEKLQSTKTDEIKLIRI